jgi:hypothetical protein
LRSINLSVSNRITLFFLRTSGPLKLIIPEKHELFNHSEQESPRKSAVSNGLLNIYFTTKHPNFQDFRVIISLPEWVFLVNNRFKSYLLTLLFFLCRAKKRKKYTSVFGVFLPLKAKNRAPQQAIDRSGARFHCNLPVFCPKCRKKPLLPW